MDTWDAGLDVHPELCAVCNSFDITQIIIENESEVLTRCQHHMNYAALEAAVGAGCGLCAVLQQGLFEEGQQERHDQSEILQMHRDLDNSGNDGFYLRFMKVIDNVREAPYWPDQRGYIRVAYDRPGATFKLRHYMPSLSLVSERDRNYIARVIPPTPNFDLCRQWVRVCSDDHTECPSMGDRDLPTRLLDVGNQPKLIVSSGGKGKYVALSHSWGGCQPPTTTAENYLSNMNAIDFDNLPKTFKDAIAVTREFGLQYLWIDCFCIIQGDAADFQRECARMAQIFENAALTIAGAAAANPYAGFLEARPSDNVVPCRLSSKQDGRPEEVFYMCSKRHWYQGRFSGQLESPLQSRAWIYQERQLSSRVLYFGSRQMYFECMQTECYEAIRYVPRQNYLEGGPKRYRRSIAEVDKVWCEMVSDYSGRHLTCESDKLPALSGIAHRVQRQSKDRYIAGLWESQLRKSLIWYADDEESTANSLELADHRAPSWSWASCDRHIAFPAMVPEGHDSNDREYRMHFDVLHVEAPAIGEDDCGEVHTGLLVLDGLVQPMLLRLLWDDYDVELEPSICTTTEPDVKLAELLPDAPKASLDSIGSTVKDVVCLFAMTMISTRKQEAVLAALVLEPIDGSDDCRYRRIGIVQLPSSVTGKDQTDPSIPFPSAGCQRRRIEII